MELINLFNQIYLAISNTVKWYDHINKMITSSRFTPVIIYLNITNNNNDEDKSDG